MIMKKNEDFSNGYLEYEEQMNREDMYVVIFVLILYVIWLIYIILKNN